MDDFGTHGEGLTVPHYGVFTLPQCPAIRRFIAHMVENTSDMQVWRGNFARASDGARRCCGVDAKIVAPETLTCCRKSGTKRPTRGDPQYDQPYPSHCRRSRLPRRPRMARSRARTTPRHRPRSRTREPPPLPCRHKPEEPCHPDLKARLMRALSTRLIWPAPTPTVAPSFT